MNFKSLLAVITIKNRYGKIFNGLVEDKEGPWLQKKHLFLRNLRRRKDKGENVLQ